jgi:hypothetical protein
LSAIACRILHAEFLEGGHFGLSRFIGRRATAIFKESVQMPCIDIQCPFKRRQISVVGPDKRKKVNDLPRVKFERSSGQCQDFPELAPADSLIVIP